MSQNFMDRAKLVSRAWTQMLCEGAIQSFKMEIVGDNIQVTYTPKKPMKFVELNLNRTEIQFKRKFA